MDLTGRIASIAAAGLSGLIAPKLTSLGWKYFTGNEPPSEDTDQKYGQIVAFAVLSAAVVTTVRFAASAGAKKLLQNRDKQENVVN